MQDILDRLARADRRHQKEAGGRLLLRSVKYVCGFVLAAFLLDVILHLAPGWRLTFLLAVIGGSLGLAAWAWYLAFVRRNRLEHIARFLESREPALGSRLINLLQLRSQTEDPSLAPLTRNLARQAVESYASEFQGAPFEALARTNELRKHLQRAGLALFLFAVLIAMFFGVAKIEFARFLDPYGDHPPYSFTRLEIVQPGPSGTNVLYGKGVVVRATASGHPPRGVFLTAFPPDHPEQAVTVPMFDKGGAGFDQMVADVRTDLLVYAHTKDKVSLSKQARIGVILTPQLEKAFVRITPPAYTGLKSEEKPYTFKGLQALVGSEIQFRLQSNRPLKEGTFEFSSGDSEPQRQSMRPSADHEVMISFPVTESGRLRFSLTDIAGIPSDTVSEGALTVTHDLPPEIRIAEPAADAFVAMDFKLKAHVEATDDYGLRTVRVHRGLNGVYSAPVVVSYDTVVRDSVETVDFNFTELGVQPGDVISIFAEAVDTAPEPRMARSRTVRLLVISVEDYNDFLRQQSDIADLEAKYSDLMEDFQELIDQQRQLGEAAEALKSALARAQSAAQREALIAEMDSLLAKQNELNHKLNSHAGRMEEFVRENPLYDVEKELQEFLREEAANIRASTRSNAAAAGAIAQRSSPAEGGRQVTPELLTEFRNESDAQLARLGASQEKTGQRVAGTLADMSLMQELLKDFNQFEHLYRVQEEIAAQSAAYNRPGQLTREDQLALKQLAATEKQIADLLQQLAQKLRDDADAAEELFPKAAASGRRLADRMEELRLRPLAQQATDQMLAANGERSHQLAERVRSEMAKLFAECEGGNCPSGNELDGYLQLQRGMKAGQTFSQMARSRKFGKASGQSQGQGMGEGTAGESGYATASGSQMNVLGNEVAASQNSATARQSARQGRGAGALAGMGRGSAEKPDVIQGLNPVNRESGYVASETVIEEYNAVVESYFRAITARKPQQP